MKHVSQSEQTAATHSAIGAIDPAAAREYLLILASTLKASLSPDFKGNRQARVNDCAMLASRLALQMVPPNATDGATDGTADKKGKVISQGRALDLLESESEKLMAMVDQIASTPQRAFDAARFEAYIRSHPKCQPQAKVVNARLLQGGRSKQTVLVTLENQGPQLPEQLVIRQDWGKGIPRTTVVFEYQVLEKLYSDELKIPRPLFMEPSEDALGAPFMAVTRLAGQGEGNLFSPPKSEKMALQLAHQLGRLHARPVADFAAIPGMTTKGFTHKQRLEELTLYQDFYRQVDTPSDTLDAAFQWLESNSAQIEGPLSLVHGDLGFHNYLVADGELGAILDWELAHLGSPAEDLGYCKGDVEQMIAWPRFMAAYREAGGPEIQPFVIDYYSLLSSMHLYYMLLQARMGILSGQVRDVEVAYCCLNLTPVLVQRMSARLRALL